MQLEFAAWRVPKAGHEDSQCEDALWPAPGTLETLEGCRHFPAVLADGASEGYLAGLWASVLVESLGDHAELDLQGRLACAWDRWAREVARFARTRAEEGRPLQWFEELGLERGAAAALLAFALHRGQDGTGGTWEAASVGDVCLFQVRSGQLAEAFPLRNAEEFGCMPALVPSRPVPLGEALRRAEGQWQAGDRFFLATDALAAWFLREHDEGRHPWDVLSGLPGDGEVLQAWVEAQREEGRLRDDDVALMILRLREAP